VLGAVIMYQWTLHEKALRMIRTCSDKVAKNAPFGRSGKAKQADRQEDIYLYSPKIRM